MTPFNPQTKMEQRFSNESIDLVTLRERKTNVIWRI